MLEFTLPSIAGALEHPIAGVQLAACGWDLCGRNGRMRSARTLKAVGVQFAVTNCSLNLLSSCKMRSQYHVRNDEMSLVLIYCWLECH